MVCYQTYNNPPDFKRSKGADDANELDIRGKDMLYLTGEACGWRLIANYRLCGCSIVFGMSGYWGKLFKSKTTGHHYKKSTSERIS